QNAPEGELELAGVEASPMWPGRLPAKFALSLTMVETEERYEGVLEYDAELFAPSTGRRMGSQLERVMESAGGGGGGGGDGGGGGAGDGGGGARAAAGRVERGGLAGRPHRAARRARAVRAAGATDARRAGGDVRADASDLPAARRQSAPGRGKPGATG